MRTRRIARLVHVAARLGAPLLAALAVAGLAFVALAPRGVASGGRGPARPLDRREAADPLRSREPLRTAEPPRAPEPPPPLPPEAEGAPPLRREEIQRGVALGLFAEDVSFSYRQLLAEIVALGATHVALIVPIYQADGSSTDLALHTRFSPTLATLADTIRLARRDRLEVTVFPIVRLSDPRPGEWRGTLKPRDPALWFAHYGDLLGDLAAVAESTGASRLVIGSELSTLDGDLDHWRPLIERLRLVFPSPRKLVYSANWDHYKDARLLDLVDEEGVVAYFNLRTDPRAPADDAALEAGWRKVRADLEAWRRTRKTTRPFVFTELGYRSRAGATAAPWDEVPGGSVDLDEQRRAFAAFRRVWAGSPDLAGLYVWNWYGYGGPSSAGYTPRGKPAEIEIRLLLESL